MFGVCAKFYLNLIRIENFRLRKVFFFVDTSREFTNQNYYQLKFFMLELYVKFDWKSDNNWKFQIFWGEGGGWDEIVLLNNAISLNLLC